MTPTLRYPTGPITPVGAARLLRGDQPMVSWLSPNGAVVFHLMGPLAVWDNTAPESIRLVAMKGLIPPWQNIEQKGATQDGSTYVTSLYDPMEVDLTVMARGKTPKTTRQVVRDWIESWDAKQPGQLSWFTPEMGQWWAPLRWSRPPMDPLRGGTFTTQKLEMRAKCHDAFWRSYDTTDHFVYSYSADHDHFTFDGSSSHDLGSGWDIAYAGTGGGYLYSTGAVATSTLYGGRRAVARNVGWASATDWQIVTITIGPLDTWPAATDTYLDIWARMNTTGTPGTDGIRARLGYRQQTIVTKDRWGTKTTKIVYTPYIKVSCFVDGVETVLRLKDVTVPFSPGDQFSLAVGGYGGNTRHYFVQRGSWTTSAVHGGTITRFSWATLINIIELADVSAVGADYRGAGFGVEVDGSDLAPTIMHWSAGDSTAAEEGGYISLTNTGDQPMWPRFLLVGPGLFGIGDGPNATSAAVFGPLYEDQMVEIQTDPRVRGVVDLGSTPATPAQVERFAQAQADYASFLRTHSSGPENASVFGIVPAQGNLYALLNGRFSKPIPPKQPGSPATPAQIAVAIEGGSSQSAILGFGTPLRRWPQ